MAFRGNVALVTGAASGMGRQACRRLASAGARVAAVDLNEEGLRETAAGGDAIRAYVQDVTDGRGVEELAARVASIAGWSPTLHFGAYNASKFAVVAYTEVLYHENRDRGVRICCVCPPPVETPLLQQAKSQPRMLERMGKPIAPDQVLDAIEEGLEKGELFVFPGRGTRFGVVMRRFFPGLVWRMVHRVEGV
jgi:NAD(P)-dependent dehydrogenase (short-subunit alcohol dehydrogenase family)